MQPLLNLLNGSQFCLFLRVYKEKNGSQVLQKWKKVSFYNKKNLEMVNLEQASSEICSHVS